MDFLYLIFYACLRLRFLEVEANQRMTQLRSKRWTNADNLHYLYQVQDYF